MDDNNGGYQCQQQDSFEDGSVASSTSSDDDDDDVVVVVTAADSADLMQDVQANLNVLAGLFPDMTARQPCVVSTKAEQDATKSGGGGADANANAKQQAIEPTSWAASGQMSCTIRSYQRVYQTLCSFGRQDARRGTAG
jgi:hypothetical protein